MVGYHYFLSILISAHLSLCHSLVRSVHYSTYRFHAKAQLRKDPAMLSISLCALCGSLVCFVILFFEVKVTKFTMNHNEHKAAMNLFH